MTEIPQLKTIYDITAKYETPKGHLQIYIVLLVTSQMDGISMSVSGTPTPLFSV